MKHLRFTLSSLCLLSLLVTLFVPRTYGRGSDTDGATSGPISLAALPSAMAVGSAAARAFVGIHNFALGSVATLDIRTGQVLRTIDVGTEPLAVRLAPRAHHVFVLAEGDDYTHGRGCLCVLDATSGALLRRISIDGYPNALALDTAHGRVLVTAHSATAISVTIYDVASLARLAQVTLPTRERPIAVAAADGRAVVLAVGGLVYLVDDVAGRLVHVTSLGQGAAFVGVDGRSARAFVADEVDNVVGMLDLHTGALLRAIAVGITPSAIGIDETTQRVLVTNVGDGTLTLLNARSGAVVRTVAVGTFPSDVVVDDQASLAAILTVDGISIVDADTGALLRRLKVGGGAATVAVGGQPAIVIAGQIDTATVRLIALGTIARPAPTLVGPSVARILAVMRAFVDAYNRHDMQGVLVTLASDIQYGDCDYTHELSGGLSGLSAVRAWLQARFAEHDLFLQASISAYPRSTSPGSFLTSPGATLEAIRVNDGILPRQHVQPVGAKIIMTSDGSHIRFVAMGGGGNCPFTRNLQ